MSDRAALVADLLAHARFLEGLDTVGVAWPAAAPTPEPGPRVSAAATADRAASLQAVRDDLGDCHRCRLAGGRKTIVFGQGNPEA